MLWWNPIKLEKDEAIKEQQIKLDEKSKKDRKNVKEKPKKRKKNQEKDKIKEQQVIEQIQEKRRQFKRSYIENRSERIAAEEAVEKRQLDYLKAVYKLQEEQEDEIGF